MNKFLIFRSDRIGDFLISAILIKSIKINDPKSHITVIASDKNFSYIKKFPYVDEVITLKNDFINKIKIILKLRKFDYKNIIIHDNKKRSKIISLFLKKEKNIIVDNQEIQSHIDIIKKILDRLNFSYDEKFLDILSFKNLKNSSNNEYIQLHFDEKWIHNEYINKFIKIQPNQTELINFILNLTKKSKNKLVITTGQKSPNILREILPKINNLNIKFFDNLTFDELQNVTLKSHTLISCHGAISHVAAASKIKQIDIIDKSYNYSRWTKHFRNYHFIYRDNFTNLSKEILQLI